MVDHLHRDATGCGLGERNGGVDVEGLPGFLIVLSLEGCLEALVGIILAQEIGLAHEEALAVVDAIAFSSVQVLS